MKTVLAAIWAVYVTFLFVAVGTSGSGRARRCAPQAGNTLYIADLPM